MLTSFVLQYTLFALITLAGLLHVHSRVNIENHIFRSAVTLLIATMYAVCWNMAQSLYSFITNRWANRNPDLEMVYNDIKSELADMDPDIELIEDDLEGNKVAMQSTQARETKELRELVTETTSIMHENETPTANHARKVAHEKAGLWNHDANGAPHTMRQDVLVSDETDVQFYVNVYAFGFTIFVIFYCVDLALLTPAISMLCGMIALSIRDAYYLLQYPEQFPETVILFRIVSFLSLMLTVLALTEMFVANSHAIHQEVASQTTLGLTCIMYVLPVLACVCMGCMDRSCSQTKRVRRAFPLAVFLSIFTVFWMQSVSFVAKDRDYYKGTLKVVMNDPLLQFFEPIEQRSESTKRIAGADDPDDKQWFYYTQYDDADSDDSSDLIYEDGVADSIYEDDNSTLKMIILHSFHKRSVDDDANDTPADTVANTTATQYLQRIIVGMREPIQLILQQNLPVVTIVVEPLLKMALTMSVITATVNHKSTDVAAAIALFTSIKQLHIEDNIFAREHLVRSIIIAIVAAAMCLSRYVPCIQRLVQKVH
jgi:hypothetical protein